MKLLPVKPTVSLDDLNKIDIRVGTIHAVDDVENSSKLVRLTVDFGDFARTVLVALKQERQDPTEIEGRQALFVVNLEPREMAGVLSEAMLFDVGHVNAITPVLAVPEVPVPNGASAG
jgi:tRNA-binding protein